jgi:hypothetical protein
VPGFAVAHDRAGIGKLIARLRAAGASEAAIERTAALRAVVRARRDLVAHRIAPCNQLCAHLAVAFPGAVGCSRSWTARSAWCS